MTNERVSKCAFNESDSTHRDVRHHMHVGAGEDKSNTEVVRPLPDSQSWKPLVEFLRGVSVYLTAAESFGASHNGLDTGHCVRASLLTVLSCHTAASGFRLFYALKPATNSL